MIHIDSKLPIEIRQAVQNIPPGPQLDQKLYEWRKNLEARNWLNNWQLNESDQAFVQFHNEYLKLRNLI